MTIKDNGEKESMSMNEFIILYQSLDLPSRELLEDVIIGDRTGKAFYIRYGYKTTREFTDEIHSMVDKVDYLNLSLNNEYNNWCTYITPKGAKVSFSIKDNKMSVSVSTNGY